MESAWRSVLVLPERYVLVAPDAMIPVVAADGEFGEWREWLGRGTGLPKRTSLGRLLGHPDGIALEYDARC